MNFLQFVNTYYFELSSNFVWQFLFNSKILCGFRIMRYDYNCTFITNIGNDFLNSLKVIFEAMNNENVKLLHQCVKVLTLKIAVDLCYLNEFGLSEIVIKLDFNLAIICNRSIQRMQLKLSVEYFISQCSAPIERSTLI